MRSSGTENWDRPYTPSFSGATGNARKLGAARGAFVGWVSVVLDAQPTNRWWVAPTTSADPPYNENAATGLNYGALGLRGRNRGVGRGTGTRSYVHEAFRDSLLVRLCSYQQSIATESPGFLGGFAPIPGFCSAATHGPRTTAGGMQDAQERSPGPGSIDGTFPNRRIAPAWRDDPGRNEIGDLRGVQVGELLEHGSGPSRSTGAWGILKTAGWGPVAFADARGRSVPSRPRRRVPWDRCRSRRGRRPTRHGRAVNRPGARPGYYRGHPGSACG